MSPTIFQYKMSDATGHQATFHLNKWYSDLRMRLRFQSKFCIAGFTMKSFCVDESILQVLDNRCILPLASFPHLYHVENYDYSADGESRDYRLHSSERTVPFAQ